MRPPTSRPNPVGDILSDVLKRVDPDQQLRAYALWNFWNDEVGETIARRAQPARFRNGILFVTVATHSWMQELQFLKDSLRDRLNVRLGANLVQDIFFVSGVVEEPSAAPEDEVVPAPSGEHLVVLPPIADAELAAAFTRIVEARAQRVARARRVRTPKSR